MAGAEVFQKRGTVGHLDQDAAKVAVKRHALGLGLDRCDGPLKFGDLIAHCGHLLTCILDLANNDLKPFEFAHGCAEGRSLKNAVVDG